ncbi:MAG: MgtC/SapB family protein [Candidatus Binatia bacterium]
MDIGFERVGEFSTLVAPLLARLGVAFVCGALIGIERGRSEKPAGLRTNILICVGAAIYTMASELSAKYIAQAPIEAGRITAQVVSGVGFIGAGAILRSGLAVTGLTTAATIWLVAAIGVLIGLGFPVLGLLATLLTLLTLILFGEIRLAGRCDVRSLTVGVPAGRPLTVAHAQAVITAAGGPAAIDSIRDVNGACEIAFHYCARHPEHSAFLVDLDRVLR